MKKIAIAVQNTLCGLRLNGSESVIDSETAILRLGERLLSFAPIKQFDVLQFPVAYSNRKAHAMRQIVAGCMLRMITSLFGVLKHFRLIRNQFHLAEPNRKVSVATLSPPFEISCRSRIRNFFANQLRIANQIEFAGLSFANRLFRRKVKLNNIPLSAGNMHFIGNSPYFGVEMQQM